MKRFSILCISLLLVLAVFTLPVLAAELAGGYYIVGDCALGKGLTFYVPSNYAVGSFTYDSSGNLFNLTNSTVYIYCAQYPGTTVYARRFEPFIYNTENGYNTYADLRLTNISDTNVEIFSESPRLALSDTNILVMILSVCLVGVGAFVILRR